MEADPDPDHGAEVAAMIERADHQELLARFGSRLAFGTAGLRAQVGAGPMRLNRPVARQTAVGVATVLLEEEPEGARRGIVVAHDARTGSDAFAADMVEVFSAAGVDVHILDGPSPTPLAAFALSQLGAGAAVVVTASHNPAADNGIKVFWGDGAQIAPPLDTRIADAITDAASAGPGAGASLPGSGDVGSVTHLGAPTAESELRGAYLAHAASLVDGPPANPLPVAATAMHGVGGTLLQFVLEQSGHGPVHQVPEQAEPDPRFPTVEFPNPEEPGAMDRVMALARRTGSAVALALDPDADRLAAAAPNAEGEWEALTGDQLGAVLAWRLLDLTEGIADRLLVNTVVSSRLVSAMAAAAGAHFRETLTGFKWLCRPALEKSDWHQVLAYEEALGYAIGPQTRDKDGITAALVMADAVCALAEEGRSVWDVLDDLARQHGAHVTQNDSLRLEGADAQVRMGSIADSLAADPPSELGAIEVMETTRPADDVLRLLLADDTRVVLRPSGTEPKFKYYCEALEAVAAEEDPAAARSRAEERLAGIVTDLRGLLS